MAIHPVQWLRVDRAPQRGQPALFLDRDGTVIENVPYLNDPEGVLPLEGVEQAIAAFRQSGYAIVVVTNQSGVARNLCTPSQYRAVEGRVQAVLGRSAPDVTYACPFHPAGTGEFGIEHPSRKPAPGMILDAGERFGIDLARSVMVGDSLGDIEAGLAAGVGRLVHVQTGHGVEQLSNVQALATGCGVTVEYAATFALVRPEHHVSSLTGLQMNGAQDG